MERAALAELIPKITAIFRHAASNFLRGGIRPKLLDRKKFMMAEDIALFAATIAQASAIAELQGRALVRAQFSGIQLAESVDPEEMKKFLEPAESIRLPPKEALKFFKALSPTRKKPLPDDWLKRHRRRAFTLAASSDKIVLNRTFNFIKKRIATGDVKRKGLSKLLDSLGVSSNNPQYAEMVVRTNVQDAYNDGYYNEVADDPDMQGYFPYWEYDAVNDDRVSPEHLKNERGGVLIGGRPSAFYPRQRRFDDVRGPRVWNCRCSFRWIDKFEAAELGLIGKKAPKKRPPPVPAAKKAVPKPPKKIPAKVKPDAGLPTFKTAAEAVDYIQENFAEAVDLEGLTLQQATDIAEGLHVTLKPHGIVLGGVGFWDKPRRGASAAYFSDGSGNVKQGEDAIVFGKTFTKNANRVAADTRKDFANKKRAFRKSADKLFDDPETTGPAKRRLRSRLAEDDITKRFTIASDSDRPLLAVTAHEAAHGILDQGDLAAKWKRELRRTTAGRKTRLALSEYGASSEKELFAEVVSAIAIGRKDLIPKRILDAYNATMANYERKLI